MSSTKDSPDKLKVFISYSRRDSHAADALVAALGAQGFEALIDRRDLPFGEKWQAELRDLIRLSDTVVWLVSPASVASQWVSWELGEVAKYRKRLIPVRLSETVSTAIPNELGEIHVLPAVGEFDVDRDLEALVRALQMDRVWVKQATRLQDRATEWLSTRRAPALRLAGSALTDAERWRDRRPSTAPQPAPEVDELLFASRRAATVRRRVWLAGGACMALVVAMLSGFAYFRDTEADRQRDAAAKQQQEAERQREVAESQKRLNSSLRRETQITEAGLLATSAKALRASDPVSAMLLALEALPDEAGDASRPLVSEVQQELDASLRNIAELASMPHDGFVSAAVFAPSGEELAVASGNAKTGAGEVRLFRLADVKERLRLPQRYLDVTIEFSRDGRLMATRSFDLSSTKAEVRLYDAATARELARLDYDRAYGPYSMMAFSPDGDLLATTPGFRLISNSETRVFQTETGSLAKQIPSTGNAMMAAFSPDGRRLAVRSTSFTDGEVIVANVAGTTEPIRLPNSGMLLDIAFSADGEFLATGSGDLLRSIGFATLYEAATGKEIARIGHNGQVRHVVFSPQNQFLATATGHIAAPHEDSELRLLALSSLKEVARLGHRGAIQSIAFSTDGKRLASLAGDTNATGVARLFDVPSGNEVATLGHDGPVAALAFSRDASIIATGTRLAATRGELRLFEAVTGRELVRLTHNGPLQDLSFSPDGRYLSTRSGEQLSHGEVRVISLDKLLPQKGMILHDYPVIQVEFSPDGKILLSNSGDPSTQKGDLRFVDVASQRTIARLTLDQVAYNAAFSPDSQLVAIATSEDNSIGTARLVRTRTGDEVARLEFQRPVNGVAFSPDGHLLAIASGATGTAAGIDAIGGSRGSIVSIVDVATKRELKRLSYLGLVSAVSFSPDGRFLIFDSDESAPSIKATTVVYDIAAGVAIKTTETPGAMTATQLSPDGKLLAINWTSVAPLEQGLRLVDFESGQTIASWTSQRTPNPFFSRSGKMMAVATDERVRIIELPAASERQSIPGRDVLVMAFSPDEKLLAVASGDNLVHLYDIATGIETARLFYQASIASLAFSPDGNALAVGTSQDKAVRMSRIFHSLQELVEEAKARAPRCLTPDQRRLYSLPPSPPVWCVERRLVPYDGDEWQAWLRARKSWTAANRAGAEPALPLAE